MSSVSKIKVCKWISMTKVSYREKLFSRMLHKCIEELLQFTAFQSTVELQLQSTRKLS